MSAGSKERLSHFVKGLKDEMIRKSNDKRIVMALPTKAEELAKQYDIKTLTKYDYYKYSIITSFTYDPFSCINRFYIDTSLILYND